jgi:hypothetical protein
LGNIINKYVPLGLFIKSSGLGDIYSQVNPPFNVFPLSIFMGIIFLPSNFSSSSTVSNKANALPENLPLTITALSAGVSITKSPELGSSEDLAYLEIIPELSF